MRLDRVLPFREARDEEDERHVHPLQLDVIDRCLVLWSNPGETVLTPFMGVGSRGLRGGACWPPRNWVRAQAVLLPAGGQERAGG